MDAGGVILLTIPQDWAEKVHRAEQNEEALREGLD